MLSVCLFVVGVLASITLASYGDTSVLYMQMVDECARKGCPPMPLSLRLTRWSCLDDCRYRIMHQLTDAALAGEKLYDLHTWEITQFHGKWPFYRLAGMQEPASVFFSLMNLAVHAYWWTRCDDRLPQEMPTPLRRRFNLLPVVGVNAWLWSIVFHTRDKPWTERADYFSAALGMLFSAYYAVVRVFGFYRKDIFAIYARRGLAAAACIIFIGHVTYLSLWRFNYGYNIKFNVGIGVFHNLVWYAWAAVTRDAHAWRGVLVLTLLLGLTALEVFDFAPLWRTIDAHALWHFSTSFALVLWYDFLLRDADSLASESAASKRKA